MKRMHMPQVSDSGEPNEHSHNALLHIAFPIVQQGRHSRKVISELNAAPMHTPANASPRHYWSSRHSSGPERIANPYPVEDLAEKPHLLLHAGFNRRFLDVLFGLRCHFVAQKGTLQLRYCPFYNSYKSSESDSQILRRPSC